MDNTAEILPAPHLVSTRQQLYRTTNTTDNKPEFVYTDNYGKTIYLQGEPNLVLVEHMILMNYWNAQLGIGTYNEMTEGAVKLDLQWYTCLGTSSTYRFFLSQKMELKRPHFCKRFTKIELGNIHHF